MSDTMVMWVVTAVFAFITSTVVPYLYARLKTQEAISRDLDSRRLSWKELAKEAGQSQQDTANAVLEKQGLPPVVQVVSVVSESHSPSTAKQRDEADLATQKAKVVAVKLALGQPPRVEPEHGRNGNGSGNGITIEQVKAVVKESIASSMDRIPMKPAATVTEVKTAVKDVMAENLKIVKKDVKDVKEDAQEIKGDVKKLI